MVACQKCNILIKTLFKTVNNISMSILLRSSHSIAPNGLQPYFSAGENSTEQH